MIVIINILPSIYYSMLFFRILSFSGYLSIAESRVIKLALGRAMVGSRIPVIAKARQSIVSKKIFCIPRLRRNRPCSAH